MSRRNKKNAEASLVNNNVKKLKNVETADNANEKLKSKKKSHMSPNENKIGSKRKLTDTDTTQIASKKARKKGKLLTNSNNLEEGLEDLTPREDLQLSNNCEVVKKEHTKSKKKKDLDSVKVYTSIETDSTVQKNSKKKKAKKDKTSIDALNVSDNYFIKHEELDLSDVKEVPCYEALQEPVDNFRGKKIVQNGSNYSSVKELNESNSDLNDSELLSQEVAKKESSEVTNKNFISWPEDDLKKLVERMQTCVPENDTLAFGTRAEKLEWSSIAFKNYSAEDCKNTWYLLQKKIRRFRLLKEVLEDAKEWINDPKLKKKKTLRHPDMPRKPLSAYIIYYLQKKDVFHKANPGLDATEISKILGQEFKNLSPEKRLKYESLAAKKKIEYEKLLEEFYLSHPDVPRIAKSQRIKPEKKPKLLKPPKEKLVKPQKERIPKRPPPPFHYYYLSELENEKEVEDKVTFKEICKERWKQLPDKNKVIWINMAELEYAKYEVELSKYVENHPDFNQNHKPILTKEEVQIKDRVAGKPTKPPGSAYNLYARDLLQSEDIKNVPVRDRLNYVSNQWKSCAEDEKKYYRDLSAKLNEKYKLEYASYLESLPEDERKLELQKNLPKRRKSEAAEAQKIPKKEKTAKKKTEKKPPVRKFLELEQPPKSTYKYFASLYTGSEPVSQAWKALAPEQKKVYDEELTKKKQAYIVNFEKYLKSLSKEELEEFCNSRKSAPKESEEEEEEEEDETSGESGSNGSGEESSDAEGD